MLAGGGWKNDRVVILSAQWTRRDALRSTRRMVVRDHALEAPYLIAQEAVRLIGGVHFLPPTRATTIPATAATSRHTMSVGQLLPTSVGG